jgi:hypothetical protein
VTSSARALRPFGTGQIAPRFRQSQWINAAWLRRSITHAALLHAAMNIEPMLGAFYTQLSEEQ